MVYIHILKSINQVSKMKYLHVFIASISIIFLASCNENSKKEEEKLEINFEVDSVMVDESLL